MQQPESGILDLNLILYFAVISYQPYHESMIHATCVYRQFWCTYRRIVVLVVVVHLPTTYYLLVVR